MGSLSPLHWISLLIVIGIFWFLVGFPVSRIMRRTGYSGWWSVLAIIPVAGLIGLWAFAFARWPIMSDDPQRTLSAGKAAR
jgi:uncharacterized membrane protein YhaH (DUF805 family)